MLKRLWLRDRVTFWSVLRTVRPRSLSDALYCLGELRVPGDSEVQLYLWGLSSPVVLRLDTSDLDVFRQVFLDEQYRIEGAVAPEYIVDAGANVGMASLYLLRKYPRAKVVAIEPDPENCAIAVRNLAKFGNRCRLIQGALWHEDAELVVERGAFADGRHWASQTRCPIGESEPTIPAYCMATILREAGFPRVDFLKIDIEGAELEVFTGPDTSFMAGASVCAVECHGPKHHAALVSTALSYGFSVAESSELTVARKSHADAKGGPDATR